MKSIAKRFDFYLAIEMAVIQRDYEELARIKHRCLGLLPVTSALSTITLMLYLGCRFKTIIETWQLTSDSRATINSALYLVVEIGLLLPNFLNHLFRCLARTGPGPAVKSAPPPRLEDMKEPPSVDIFITCAGEDADTIILTTEAACAIDYPSHRFRVVVLDDAGSVALSGRVNAIKLGRSNLFYTARTKGPDHHFKAGNLNYGLNYVGSLEGGAADFVAALDADMIPDPGLLRALVPHLLIDERLALVQPPQVSAHVCLQFHFLFFSIGRWRIDHGKPIFER